MTMIDNTYRAPVVYRTLSKRCRYGFMHDVDQMARILSPPPR